MPCRIHLPVAQLDNATDSDSGEWGFKSLRAGQKRTPYGVSFFGLFRIRRDLKPTVKKMPLWGIFREERLWRHSYAQDATSEAESLSLYKVLRAEVVIRWKCDTLRGVLFSAKFTQAWAKFATQAKLSWRTAKSEFNLAVNRKVCNLATERQKIHRIFCWKIQWKIFL